MTAATAITWLRVLITPGVIYTIQLQQYRMALLLFITAAVTDVLDGWCARIRNEQTLFGACLDPIADKFLVLSTLGALAWGDHYPVLILPTIATIFYIKEFLLLGSIAYAYIAWGSVRIEPTVMGKLATGVICITITGILAQYAYGFHIDSLWVFLSILSAIMSIYALCQYVMRALIRVVIALGWDIFRL